MTTDAPPAYTGVDEGAPLAYGNLASAPAYNPGAMSAPPDPPSAQPQPAANVTYVDQFGNPVPAPSAHAQPAAPANVTYVDQYGNPVNPPSAQPQAAPAIKYVDQYGNPVAAPSGFQAQPQAQPQPVIKYVDQYGNPVAPPTASSSATPLQAPTIKYVDQYGNPVAAPTTGAAPRSLVVNPGAQPRNQGCCGDANNCARTASMIMGIFGALFLFIGLVVDQLAQDRLQDDWSIRYVCGWTQLRIKCPDYYDWSWSSSAALLCDQEHEWSETCDAQRAVEDYGIYYGPDLCATQTAASLSLTMSILAFLLATLGFFTVPPCCKKTLCCKGCPRWMFVLSNLCTVLSLVLWFSIADYCQGDNHLDSSSGYSWSWTDEGFQMGATFYMNIFGGIFTFIAMCLAVPPTS
eukprot:CAMPEP_0202689428 /NCGR_PEP_ID=MMETSP1385-20130828/4691_1 /ASSEMBLY_ACC=CAM_ASM_000861 /TAXON_ID=933848 /ORGANISM="Elphidium margaritaceum" /LENGTH=404 /DNA_ID=CAMNT_0049344559 /DNA_START=31 /DNA_END=1245 /DNA_ORIENTATION=-